MYISYFSADFEASLKKYQSIRKHVERKVRKILENPYILGERLKYRLQGKRSAPVKKNFIIIYSILEELIRDGCVDSFDINDIENYPPNTIKFYYLAPHDEAYEYMIKLMNKRY